MRALYLTEEPITFSGTMVRGGQIHVRNVVEGLRARGHEVHLIDWNSKSEREFQHSIPPRMRYIVDPGRSLQRAVSVGREADIDIIVSKTRKTYLPGLLAGRKLNVPHVVHVGSSPGTIGSSLHDRIDSLSIRTRLKLPHDGYFVVCESITGDLMRLGVPRRRIFDVKNAVDTERFRPGHVPVELYTKYRRMIEKIEDGEFLLGFVGGLQPYKGLDDLATAVKNTETDCHAIIAGDGPERKQLECQFGSRGTFLGAVPYEQVPAVYDRIDALVLPSYTEGLPRVVLEAQATGKPVIATRVGGVPEVIDYGETGLLVDPHAPDQISSAIDKLAGGDELLDRLSKNGRHAVVESYSWETMYERYDQYLSEIMTDGKR